MAIVKYEVINPVVNYKKPFLNSKGFLVIPHIGGRYKYYVECARNNPFNYEREYYVMLSNIKFDSNCRRCKTNSYGQLTIKLRGELYDFAVAECNTRGNVKFEYMETEEGYDVFQLS